jgi:subtilisin family serine protease
MRKLMSTALAALVLLVGACADGTTPAEVAVPSAADAAARDGPQDASVIIVFRDGVTDVPGLARQLVAQSGGELGFTYTAAVRGFSARIPATALAGLQRHPSIALIEPDQVMSISATQSNATWGLDRIDQRDLPLNGTYVYNADGSGVRSYIIDTGIRTSHNEFGGRASSGYTAINDGRGTDDCNGHGTHVAGTVGGATYGVAKNTALVAVRVLNCRGSGTTSGVIAGVDWVTANHVKPAVANMSLGGGASSTLDNAVGNAVAAGVTFVVAAGNSNANACNYSPARVASAVTVGATTSSDARASYSNFGSCLDIFAPR